MKKILIPIDGSDHSQRAVKAGLEIASLIDCKIVLLRVADLAFIRALPKLVNEIKHNINVHLNETKESFGTLAEKVETKFLKGDPASVIIRYLKKNDFDLVIMGFLGTNSTLHRLLIGSVTMKVLHSVKQPVLVVK